eukprot:gb/GECG01013962.1/.p1 GENE.gb/GECG01013962.1/~~gb/GECG01013962.1/.p1  ORF type:complete len:235 (+),score=19.46 gb/GECG01013962.1/:1-705(+)
MTTSTELRQYYSRCVYCKMLCPIWDCSTVHIPEGQDLVNGEEYTFVIKPDKTLLCCVPLPLISVMIAPCCCTSFDIHSVSSDGQLRVSRYGVCFSRDKVYEDVAGMDSFDRCGESNRLYNFKYRYLDGSFGIALNSNYSNVEIGDKQQIMEAVEGFLKHRRRAAGGQALTHSDRMEALTSGVSVAMSMAQRNAALLNNIHEQSEQSTARNKQGYVPPQFSGLNKQQSSTEDPDQ